MNRRLNCVLFSVAGAALIATSLTACLDVDGSADSADATPWEGPTDGVWGEHVISDTSIIGFEEPWDMDFASYRIQVQGLPTYGPLSSSGTVYIFAEFNVTKTRETNDPPVQQIGWEPGIRSEFDDESLVQPMMNCENEDLEVGESTTCTGRVNAKEAEVENFSWRFGMHQVAAFPSQTFESAPK